MSTSSGGAASAPSVSSQEIEALLKQALRRITYTTVEEHEASHPRSAAPQSSVRVPPQTLPPQALSSPRLGGSLREPGGAGSGPSRRSLRRTVTFIDDAGRVSNVEGVGRRTLRRLANTVSPPAFTGRDLVDQLSAAARGRPRADCVRLAQEMLARGAITVVPTRVASSGTGISTGRTGGVENGNNNIFNEEGLYATRACEELSERQVRALVGALRAAGCVGAREGKHGVVEDAVQGAAAVQCWLAAQDLFVASRATAVVMGQELLNKGFLRAVRGCSECFRDSRDLYALSDGRPCRYWGTMLKRGNKSRAWNMRWFVCRDAAEKKIWFYQTPQHARPKKAIDLEHACVRTPSAAAGTDAAPLCFDICTPNRVWEMRALSTVTMAAWLGVIAAMAGEVAEDNRLLDSPDTLIATAAAAAAASQRDSCEEGDSAQAPAATGTSTTPTTTTTKMVLVPSHSPFYEGTTLDNPPSSTHSSDGAKEQRATDSASPAQPRTATVHVAGFRTAPMCLCTVPSEAYPHIRTITPALGPGEVVTCSAFSAMTNALIVATSTRSLYLFGLEGNGTTEQILLTDTATAPCEPITKMVSCVVTGTNGTTTEFFWCIDGTGTAYIWDIIRQTLQGRFKIADTAQTPIVVATDALSLESTGTHTPMALTAGPRPGTVAIHHICTDDQSPQFGTVATTTLLQIPDCTQMVTALSIAPNGTLWITAGNVYLHRMNNPSNPVFKKLDIIDDCIRCSLSPVLTLLGLTHKEAWTVHTKGDVVKWDIENGKERNSTAYVATLPSTTPKCFLLYDGSLLMDASTENNNIFSRVSRFFRTTEQIMFEGAQAVTVLSTNTKRDTLAFLVTPSTQKQCMILVFNIATTCPLPTTK